MQVISNERVTIAASEVTGKLGVMHLQRYWEKCRYTKSGQLAPDALSEEWNTDTALLAALGLGLEQTIKQIYQADTDFATFENWVLTVNNGKLSQQKINAFNAFVGNQPATAEGGIIEKVISEAEMEQWNKNGYIIIREAVSKQDCENTIAAICEFIGVKRDDPSTWYAAHPSRQGIMVQLFQHPALEKNRQSKKIRSAYEQLWGRKDIWVNTDRVGFNPPETMQWKFPGPNLHWDVSLALPIPFGLQGILYLTDTAANQGAFTLVPGFQNRVDDWLQQLPTGTNPRTEDIHALGAIPVVANAGDFIIWHQALPHGSSPNTSALPRFVQYINYAPLNVEIRDKWI